METDGWGDTAYRQGTDDQELKQQPAFSISSMLFHWITRDMEALSVLRLSKQPCMGEMVRCRSSQYPKRQPVAAYRCGDQMAALTPKYLDADGGRYNAGTQTTAGRLQGGHRLSTGWGNRGTWQVPLSLLGW